MKRMLMVAGCVAIAAMSAFAGTNQMESVVRNDDDAWCYPYLSPSFCYVPEPDVLFEIHLLIQEIRDMIREIGPRERSVPTRERLTKLELDEMLMELDQDLLLRWEEGQFTLSEERRKRIHKLHESLLKMKKILKVKQQRQEKSDESDKKYAIKILFFVILYPLFKFLQI